MAVIILRLVLILAPVVLLLAWLKSRSKKDQEEYSPEEEGRKLMLRVGVLTGLVVVLAALLFFMDDSRAPSGQIYVPPHMKDGVLIPGQFKDAESKEQGDEDGVGSGASDQN